MKWCIVLLNNILYICVLLYIIIVYRLCIHSTHLINAPHEPRLCSLSLLPICYCAFFFVMQNYLLLNIFFIIEYLLCIIFKYSQLDISFLHLIRPEQALVSRRLVTQVKTIDWFACIKRIQIKIEWKIIQTMLKRYKI